MATAGRGVGTWMRQGDMQFRSSELPGRRSFSFSAYARARSYSFRLNQYRAIKKFPTVESGSSRSSLSRFG